MSPTSVSDGKSPIPSTVRYRRWLAPVDHLNNWPFEKTKYVQMKRDLFEQWESTLRKKESGSGDSQFAANLTRIVLRGRLEGKQLVSGEGFFEFQDDLLEVFSDSSTDKASGQYPKKLPLSPWQLPITNPRFDDDKPAIIAQDVHGSLQLFFTDSQTDATNSGPNSTNRRVSFQWTLRPTFLFSGDLLFDFQLPSAASFEVILDLPESYIPFSPTGFVLRQDNVSGTSSDSASSSEQKRWHILCGSGPVRQIKLVPTLPEKKRTPLASYQQTLLYSVRPQGLEVTSKITFDETRSLPEKLSLFVDSPLRIIDIRAGEESLSWSVKGGSSSETTTQSSGVPENAASSASSSALVRPFSSDVREEKGKLEVVVDIRTLISRGKREIQIIAQSPLPEGAFWQLPRIQLAASQCFWTETRCGVVINTPLICRKISCSSGGQVLPLTSYDRTQREIFTFQFFAENARVGLHVTSLTPPVSISSVTQIQWGQNDIRGTMVVECNKDGEDWYSLEFPVAPNWTIDALSPIEDQDSAVSMKDIMSWEIVTQNDYRIQENSNTHAADTSLLIVRLKHPIPTTIPIRFQITGRFLAGDSGEWHLGDLVPLRFPTRPEGTHHIAFLWESRFQLQYLAPFPHISSVDSVPKSILTDLLSELAAEDMVPLTDQTQSLLFRLKQLQPNYHTTSQTTATLERDRLRIISAFTIYPHDSAVDRVLIQFKQLPTTIPIEWTSQNTSNPFQVKRLSAEQIESLAANEFRQIETNQEGDWWEVRLRTPQSHAYTIQAALTLPLDEEIAIPLTHFPLAVAQKSDVYFDAPRLFPYHIIESNLKSLLLPVSDNFHYPTTRAAFRYDTVGQEELSASPSLSLKRMQPEEIPPSTWCWSLQLDSIYEADGAVKNTADFHIENRGQESFSVFLPAAVEREHILAVWVNDQRLPIYAIEKTEDTSIADDPSFVTIWQLHHDETDSKEQQNLSLQVPFPEGKRFVCVSIEYTIKETPLNKRTQIIPCYPSASIPILDAQWMTWFPKGYEISNQKPVLWNVDSKTMPRSDGNTFWTLLQRMILKPIFPLFNRGTNWFASKQHQAMMQNISQLFFDAIDMKWKGIATKRKATGMTLTRLEPSSDRDEQATKPTWGNLFAVENILKDKILLHQRSTPALSSQEIDSLASLSVSIFVDADALVQLGITPTKEIEIDATTLNTFNVHDFFKENGLILLMGQTTTSNNIEEYTFYVTSIQSAALYHQFDSSDSENNVRYLHAPVLQNQFTEVAESSSQLSEQKPKWILCKDWQNSTTESTTVWNPRTFRNQWTSISGHWSAIKTSLKANQTIYITSTDVMTSYYWYTFLVTILIATRKPLFSPAILFPLLFFTGFLSCLVSSYYGYIICGAFLGLLVTSILSIFYYCTRKSPLLDGIAPLKINTTDDSVILKATAQSAQMAIFITIMLLGILSNSGNTSASAAEPPNHTTNGVPIHDINDFADQKSSSAANSLGASAENREPFRVFFPTDEQNRIVGNTVWLPEEFFRVLGRWTSPSGLPEIGTTYHFIQAQYQGALLFNTLAKQFELNDFKVVFNVLLENDNATLVLPDMPVRFDGILWNGKPLLPSWKIKDLMVDSPTELSSDAKIVPSKQRELILKIENETPGVHVLEMSLFPQLTRYDAESRISFDIPQTPNTTLRLVTTPDAPVLSVNNAKGAVTPNSVFFPTFLAHLGSVDTLSISWPNEFQRRETDVNQVEQFFWLQARPSQVEIWMTFQYQLKGEPIHSIDLVTDARWQLSGRFHCKETPVASIETTERMMSNEYLDSAEVTRITLQNPVNGSLTIQAGFVLKNFNGMGRIRLPNIHATNSRILKTQLAISADPRLELDLPPQSIMRDRSPAWESLFLKGPLELPPLAEYDVIQFDSNWTIGIRARSTTLNYNETKSFYFDQFHSTVSFIEEMKTESDILQQSFYLPEWVEIDSIEVRDLNRNLIETRWNETGISQQFDKSIWKEYLLFFHRPISGSFLYNIDCHLREKSFSLQNTNESESRLLPSPYFPDAQCHRQTLHVFRAPSVLVNLSFASSLWEKLRAVPISSKPIGTFFPVGTWVRTPAVDNSLELTEVVPDSKSPSVDDSNDTKFGISHPNELQKNKFALVQNYPKVDGEHQTWLRRNENIDSWEVVFDLNWNIQNGEIEIIRILWDDNNGDVESISPNIPWKIEQHKGHSYLTLFPETPLVNSQRIQIRTTLHPNRGTVRMPKFEIEWPQNVSANIENFCILPKHDLGQLLTWKWSGLEPLSAPPAAMTNLNDEPDLLWNPQTEWLLHVADPQYSATMIQANAFPVATCYDVDLFVQLDGTLFGIATVDIKDIGQDGIVLTLPPSLELLQTTWYNIVSKGTKLGENQWRLDIGISDYPVRLEIIFRGHLKGISQLSPTFRATSNTDPNDNISLQTFVNGQYACVIALPKLENVEVHETIWTISFEALEKNTIPPIELIAKQDFSHPDHNTILNSIRAFYGVNEVYLGIHRPTTGQLAELVSQKMCLLRMDNLLAVLKSLPAPLANKQADNYRWGEHWKNQWNSLTAKINISNEKSPSASPEMVDVLPFIIVPNEKNALIDSHVTLLGAQNSSVAFRALQARWNDELEKAKLKKEGEITSAPLLYWANLMTLERNQTAKNSVQLSGFLSGPLTELRCQTHPNPYRWHAKFNTLFWFQTTMTCCFFISIIGFHPLRKISPLPFFWSAIFGLLLCTILPMVAFLVCAGIGLLTAQQMYMRVHKNKLRKI
ncbi:MAG: hypothetical protein ACRCUY_07775 [Thermoguttaceae bacterium]